MAETALIDPIAVRTILAHRFDVDAKAGTLVWRTPPKTHPRMLGKPAGSVWRSATGKLYCYVKIDGRAYKRGWLIFLWEKARWPSPMLDHRDGNSLNDRIGNLREATGEQNAWNHKRRAKRAPEPMGVRRLPSGRFTARIAHKKRQITIGSFDTESDARHAYLKKRKELFHEFA